MFVNWKEYRAKKSLQSNVTQTIQNCCMVALNQATSFHGNGSQELSMRNVSFIFQPMVQSNSIHLHWLVWKTRVKLMVWSHGDTLTELTYKLVFSTCWMACKRTLNCQYHWRKWKLMFSNFEHMFYQFSLIAVHQLSERLCHSPTNTSSSFKISFCTVLIM